MADDDYLRNTGDFEEPDFYDDDYVPSEDYSRFQEEFDTPKKIFDYLEKNLYGHTEYKKAISVYLWKAIHGHKPSGALLVAGESGSGKTELFRVLKEIYSNISICDGSRITAEGYRGQNKLTSGMATLDFSSDLPPIYVIDEFDKLIHKGNAGWSGSGLLSELLKCLEGTRINISADDSRKEPKWIDSSQIVFVLIGSFSNLTENQNSKPIGFNAPDNAINRASNLTQEMISSELSNELRGRISQIIILNALTSDDYFKILKNSDFSPIAKMEKEFGVHFNISRKKYREIANRAYEEKTGVRSMNHFISQYLNEQLFENPDVKEISIP